MIDYNDFLRVVNKVNNKKFNKKFPTNNPIIVDLREIFKTLRETRADMFQMTGWLIQLLDEINDGDYSDSDVREFLSFKD